MGKELHFFFTIPRQYDSFRRIIGHECKLLLPILLSGDEHSFVFGLFLSGLTLVESVSVLFGCISTPASHCKM